MSKREISQAKKLLYDYTQRYDVCGAGDGSLCITAYWLGGGQRIFYLLDAIRDWIQDHN